MKQEWRKCPLRDCVDAVKIPRKIKRKQFLERGEFPVISQEAEVINGFWDEKADVITLEKPVVVYGDHTQVVKYVDFDFVAGADGIKVLSPKQFLDPRYLYYYLMGNPVDSLGYSRHYRLLKNLDVRFPGDVSEQKRIVAILDEAFAAIDAATANAEKNRTNARELFEAQLNVVFSDTWNTSQIVSLQDLATHITDGDHQPPPKVEKGVPFITISNVEKRTRRINFSDTFMVPRSYFDDLKPDRKPKRGDVLYTVTGSFGIPVIVDKKTDFCFQRHIGLVRPNAETNSEWLYYLLLSPQVYRQAHDGATGTAQKTVSLKLLRHLTVPKVPTVKQAETAERLNGLEADAGRLEELYRHKLSLLPNLKQSILQKAFTGELTADHPASDPEPAGAAVNE